jgi:hypothetical protein
MRKLDLQSNYFTDICNRMIRRNAYDEPIQLSDMLKLMPKNIKVEKVESSNNAYVLTVSRRNFMRIHYI